ncbi:ATP-binding protein [Candidatus Lokiarchaeum ossiferum]|uniref:ATP-binding protein n=1 Tax=Candidatus Lokiarchaeum ossiferum TaxID=2951803 RepID=UPI00352F406B
MTEYLRKLCLYKSAAYGRVGTARVTKMVKIYTRVGTKTSKQHKAIIRWLEQNEKYKDAVIFIEFTPTGKGARQIDMAIFLPEGIHVLELKGHRFTKITKNGFWIHHDFKLKKHVELVKKIGKEPRPENPYDQATNTANAFLRWIRRNVDEINPTLKKQISSDEFKIFPIVYIDKTHFLLEKDVERMKWCKLAIGTDELHPYLKRTWLGNTLQSPLFDSDDYEIMADLLSLSDLEPTRKGPENQTLIPILDFMYTQKPQWISTEEIKDAVFGSGEKKKSQIRSAIIRAKGENLIIKGEQFFELNPLLVDLLSNGHSLTNIYTNWDYMMDISKLHQGDPDLFKIYVDHTLSTEIINENIVLHRKSSRTFQLIPRSLKMFNLDDILSYYQKMIPQFFRHGGIKWIDIEKNYVVPFSDRNGADLVRKIFQNLRLGEQTLILGDAATGKSTLARLIGAAFLDQKIPVIMLTPNDFDEAAVNSILEFAQENQYNEEDDMEEQEGVKESEVTEILICIENIHLATAQQCVWLKKIFQAPQNFQLLLTSRKSELMFQKENILECLTTETSELTMIDLNDEMTLTQRISEIIEHVLIKTQPTLSTTELRKIKKKILSQTNQMLPLMRIEINLLLILSQENTFTDIWEDDEKWNAAYTREFVRYFDQKIEAYAIATEIPIEIIRKIYFIIIILSKLELPLRQDLLKEIGSCSQEDLYKLIKFWEEQAIFAFDQASQNSVHPVLAEKFLEIMPTINPAWKSVESEMMEDLESIQGESLENKINQRVFEIDPSLFHEEDEDHSINYENLTVASIVEYFDELYVEDFIELIQNVMYKSLRISDNELWKVWDTITIERILTTLHECEDLHTMIRLLDLVFTTKWPHFQELLEELSPEFLMEVFVANDRGIRYDLKHYLEEWNYSRIIVVEIKMFLKQVVQGKGFSHLISLTAFQTLDSLDPENILKELCENQEFHLYQFLRTLREHASRYEFKSQLREKIHQSILKDALKTYSIEFFCTILSITAEVTDPDSIPYQIIDEWDLTDLHGKFLSYDVSWLKYFFSLISKWTHPKIIALIKKFSLDDILQIWKNSHELEDAELYLTDLMQTLEKVKWHSLSLLLDHFGINYFVERLLDENSIYRGNDTSLFFFLIQSDSALGKQFKREFDFISYIKIQGKYLSSRLLDQLDHLQIPNKQEIVKELFLKEFDAFWISLEMKKIIKFSELHQWNWHEWMDLDQLFGKVETNVQRSKKLIEDYQELGWQIPLNLSEQIVKKQDELTMKYLENLTTLEKARDFYRKTETKSDAIELFSKTIQKLNETQNHEDLRILFREILKLDGPEKDWLLGEISPNIFTRVEFKSYHGMPKVIDTIRKLNEADYPAIAQLLANIYINVPHRIEEQFWGGIQDFKRVEKCYAEIWHKLWETHQYEKILRLPPAAFKISQNYIEKIEDLLRHEKTGGRSLWEVFFRVHAISSKTSSKDLKEFLTSKNHIFNKLKPFNEIITILRIKPKEIVELFLDLDAKVKQTIIRNSASVEQIRFMQTLFNLQEEPLATSFVKILDKEEWMEIIEQIEPKYSNVIKLLLKKYFPEIQIQISEL